MIKKTDKQLPALGFGVILDNSYPENFKGIILYYNNLEEYIWSVYAPGEMHNSAVSRLFP